MLVLSKGCDRNTNCLETRRFLRHGKDFARVLWDPGCGFQRYRRYILKKCGNIIVGIVVVFSATVDFHTFSLGGLPFTNLPWRSTVVLDPLSRQKNCKFWKTTKKMAFRDFYKCFVLKNMSCATWSMFVKITMILARASPDILFILLVLADRLIISTSHDVHEVNCVVNSVTARVAVKMTWPGHVACLRTLYMHEFTLKVMSFVLQNTNCPF